MSDNRLWGITVDMVIDVPPLTCATLLLSLRTCGVGGCGYTHFVTDNLAISITSIDITDVYGQL